MPSRLAGVYDDGANPMSVRSFCPSSSRRADGHVDEVPLGESHGALDSVEGSKPPQRLSAAMAHKDGAAQTEPAE